MKINDTMGGELGESTQIDLVLKSGKKVTITEIVWGNDTGKGVQINVGMDSMVILPNASNSAAILVKE